MYSGYPWHHTALNAGRTFFKLTHLYEQAFLRSLWNQHSFSSCECALTFTQWTHIYTDQCASSFSLTATVYGWWAKKPKTLRILSITGRIVPITLAVISIVLLQLEFTHRSFMVYMAVANAQCRCLFLFDEKAGNGMVLLTIMRTVVISLVGACVFLLMILFKYMQTRRQLKSWDGVQYGKGGTSTATSGLRSLRSRANSNRTRRTNGSFDNWLVIRLSIAFVMLW